MFNSDLFKDKTVLITGGSSETGPALVEAFAKVGANIAFTYHSNEGASAEIIEKFKNVKIHSYWFDILQLETCYQLIKSVLEDFNKIDFFINCASTRESPALIEINEEEWDHCSDGNFKNNFFLAREIAKGMIKSDGGSIVNFSATSSIKFTHGIYGLAKAAVTDMTKFMAMEFSPKVRVNCIIPGLINNEEYDENLRKSRAEGSPLKAIVSAEELGNMCVALCSPLFKSTTGESIIMDGGYYLKEN